MIQNELDNIKDMFDKKIYKEDNDLSDDDSEGEEDNLSKEEEIKIQKKILKA